jgi:hypothetical protein
MKGETRRRRGFIAQQAEKVDDLYTFLGIEQEIDGEKFNMMNVDYTAIIADLLTVVQDLIRRVDTRKLRSIKNPRSTCRGQLKRH